MQQFIVVLCLPSFTLHDSAVTGHHQVYFTYVTVTLHVKRIKDKQRHAHRESAQNNT